MVIFSLEYWRQEIGLIDPWVRAHNEPDTLGLVLCGLCWLSSGMCRKLEGDERAEVVRDTRRIIHLMHDQMGPLWFRSHAIVVNGHVHHEEVAQIVESLLQGIVPT